MSLTRLAACATHPIQYQAPIWRRLAHEPGVTFHAYFGTDMSVRGYNDVEFGANIAWDSPLASGYEHTFLSTDPTIQAVTVLKPGATGLVERFRAFRPDVVMLTAYGARFHAESFRAAKAVKAKIVMRHEASDAAAARSRWKGFVRDLFLRRLYARIDAFAVIGTEARRHLRRLGVPAAKLVSAPYCVDTHFFETQVAQWSPRRQEIRRDLGIEPNDVVFAFAGKLVPKKDPLLIPAALKLIDSAVHERLHLLVAGDGELRRALEEACAEILGRRAHFFGFLNQSEIGRIYAAADALILPSRRGAGETWGLVVNEAMQFGLSAIVSDGVGCATDLAGGDGGSIFRSGDPAALARCIICYSSLSQQKRQAVSSGSRTAVAAFSVEQAALGIKSAIDVALHHAAS